MKKGDVVRVKPGVKDADCDVDLSGWQGRVIEVRPDNIVMVAWDSHTLRHDLPATMITACEEQGCTGQRDIELAGRLFLPQSSLRARRNRRCCNAPNLCELCALCGAICF
jgi:hypothetical protein